MRYKCAMHRYVRLLTLPLAAVTIAALAIGGALAREGSPEPTESGGVVLDENEGEDEGVSAANVDRIVERLNDAIETEENETDAAAFTALADELGVGGAVRALLWADAHPDLSVDDILALRAGDDDNPPMGWGKIRKEYDPDGELGLHPGIGSVMGNGPDDPGAHGRARADEAKNKGSDD
jgi:hypothetical protein